MATWYLINNVQFGTNLKIAGELVDDVQEDVAAIRVAGGVLAPSSNATIAAAAALALQKKLAGGSPEACEAIMQAALDVSQELKETTPVADTTALAAIPAVLRANGMQAVKLDDDTLWVFDSGSVATASTWTIVPAAGTGRWLRKDQLTGAVHAAVADAAALAAITAADRANGMQAVKLDDDTHWRFDSGSVAAASNWVIAPAAGTGRWLRKDETVGAISQAVADTAAIKAIAAAGRVDGMAVVKLDTGTLWTFAAASTAAETDWVIAPTAGTGRWIRNHLSLLDLLGSAAMPGAPMTTRLRMLGAPGVIAPADYVTVGTTIFEFRDSTPPIGGTAGRVWVYAGVDSAASRANLIASLNGVVNAAITNYNGLTGPNVIAAAGVTLGDIILLSAAAPGGVPVASSTALATTDNLTTVTDIWDAATMYGGRLRAPRKSAHAAPVTLTAAHVAKATIQFQFDFTPTRAIVINRMRPQNEAWTIVGDSVSLTLAGGGSPNNQANDVIECWASE